MTYLRTLLSPSLSALCAIAVVASAGCGSSPTAPPPPPPVNTAPVVQSVTPSRLQVEAGQDVEVTAVAQDNETAADLLRYSWSASPSQGTFTGTGKTVRWSPPTDGTVPGDYTLRVTVTDAAGLTATGSSPSPIRVNDAVREMRQLATTFIGDFTNSANPADFVVRNFTDTCNIGKQEELRDIANNRRQFDLIVNVTPPALRDVRLNTGVYDAVRICRYTPRSACAMVLTRVDWRSRWSPTNTFSRPPGTWEHVIGDSILFGIYDRQQWYLCDSYFVGNTLSTLRPFLP